MPFSLPPLPYGQLRLVQQSSLAEVFAGVDPAGMPVTVVMLTDLGAGQPAVRSVFSDAVATGVYVAGRAPVCAADLAGARPWVASQQIPGLVGVEWILENLSAVGASTTMNGIGPVSGMGGPVPPSGSGWMPPGAEATTWSPPEASRNSGGFLSKQPAGVIVAMAVCAVLVLVGGTAGIIALQRDAGKPDKVTQSQAPDPSAGTSVNPSPAPSGTASKSASASASVTPAITGTDKPVLRKVTQRSLIGPNWADTDATYTMDFAGWPFAFRTAKTWGCLGGTIESMPEASARGCVDEQNASAKQRINIMIRPCPTTCTASEQSTMNTQWFDQGAKSKTAADGRTAYVETAQNSDGYYLLDVSTYVVEKPGSGTTLKYQVGLSLKSPPQTKDVVLKALNDVYSQIQ